MKIAPIVCLVLLLISFFADKKKTLKALKIAWKKQKSVLPAFIQMLILIAVTLSLIPNETISKHLNESGKFLSLSIAAAFGSISAMPGFVAFPLAAILKDKGVPLFSIAAFTTTLMMVGIVSIPLEKKYFGLKFAIIRNALFLVISLVVSICVGLAYGEFF